MTHTFVNVPNGSPKTVWQYVLDWTVEAMQSPTRMNAAIGALSAVAANVPMSVSESKLIADTVEAIRADLVIR